MQERKFFMQSNTEELFERPFSMLAKIKLFIL